MLYFGIITIALVLVSQDWFRVIINHLLDWDKFKKMMIELDRDNNKDEVRQEVEVMLSDFFSRTKNLNQLLKIMLFVNAGWSFKRFEDINKAFGDALLLKKNEFRVGQLQNVASSLKEFKRNITLNEVILVIFFLIVVYGVLAN